MIKYSRQRVAILDFLKSRKDHPTAETVYTAVKEDFPNISLGTVYRNLALLSDMGVIQKVSAENGPDRFDYNAQPHTHFYCRGCDSMIDIDVPIEKELIYKVAEAYSGLIEKSSVQFTGLCPECVRNTHD